MIASILAVGATPTGAAEIKAGDDNKAEPSVEATFSACVGDANDDAGFTDTAGLGAEDAINCLAYYGITTGKTATTFDPNSNVTRSQMALFLYRAADVAGLDLMGGDMTASFGDIADQGAERSNAINALARNGILAGRTSMAFEPDADITRAEMAVALVNLTRHTAPGNFVQAGPAKGRLVAVNADATKLDHFADARRLTPRDVDTHISYAYELGIATGYPDATFRPNEPVSRKHMASFITRALAHSNLRPAGLTVQSDEGELTASLRNADFEPVANELVDAFYVAATREDRAFNNDGECRSIVKAVDSSDNPCEIHVTDSATDADGNTPLNGLDAADIGKGVTVWVWTGDADDEVDDDTDLVEFDQGPVNPPVAADKLTVKPSQARTPTARFGTAVQFTGQLQYVDGGLDKDTAVGIDGENAAEYELVVHTFTDTIDKTDEARFAVANATGAVTAQGTDGDALGVVSVSAPETLKTDADGKFTFSLSTGDPDPKSTKDSRTVVYVLEPVKNNPDSLDASNDPKRIFGYVVFGEAASEVTTVKVEPIGAYAVVGTATKPASHGVTVTVTDQYGRPMRNQAVTLESGNIDSTMPGPRRTGSNGTVRIFYSHTGTAAATEALTATWNGDAAGADDTGGPGCRNDQAAGLDRCGTASVYWAVRAPDGAPDAATPVIAADLEENEIVVNALAPTVVRYDANDIFSTSVPGAGGAAVVTYRDMDEFEELLATVVAPANLALDDGTTGKRTATLTWAGSYDADDEDARTFFTFVLAIA